MTDRETSAGVDTYDWRADPTWDAGKSLDWRNPSFEVCVCLVAAAWAIPGVLVGLMANLFLPFTDDVGIAVATGAVVFAVIGGRMEAAG